MSADIFVDTNVLIYMRDASEPAKQGLARTWMTFLWKERRGRVSYQVLQEYYVNVTRKLKPGLPLDLARADVRSLLLWRPIAADSALLEAAFALQDSVSLSFWDSMIVAAAQVGGCRHLLSEDMQHGRTIANLRILNPFLVSPSDL